MPWIEVDAVFFADGIEGHMAMQSFLLDKMNLRSEMRFVGSQRSPMGVNILSRNITLYPEQYVLVYPDQRIEQRSEEWYNKHCKKEPRR